jgi:hypothetical protein
MLKTRTVLPTLGVATLCLMSFVAGFGYAVEEFHIDLFSPIGKYYVRLTTPVFVEVNNSKVQLPKGTVLYREYNHKNDNSWASLRIVPKDERDREEFEEKLEVLRILDKHQVPDEYFYHHAGK